MWILPILFVFLLVLVVLAMIVGGIVISAGIARHLPLRVEAWGGHAFGIAFVLFFLWGGVTAAWQMWPAAAAHIRATEWELLPCQVTDTRCVRSGKRSSNREVVVRYTAAGRSRETIVRGDFARGGNSETRQCRVNPAQPWQVTLSWGWRGQFGNVLFPVPFLAVGVFGLGMIIVGILRQLTQSEKPRMSPSGDRRTEAAALGFVLVFAGSIVGVFVFACAEMWLSGDGRRWFLTVFLIPFVWMVLKIARAFGRSARRVLHR